MADAEAEAGTTLEASGPNFPSDEPAPESIEHEAKRRRISAAHEDPAADGLACTACTLRNAPGASQCEVCGTVLGVAWACAVCTLLNPPALAECAACETPRGAASAPTQALAGRAAQEAASAPPPGPTAAADCTARAVSSRRSSDAKSIVLPPKLGLSPRFSLVFLHGFCNTSAMYAQSPAFTLFRCQGLRVVLPTARVLQITAHGGNRQNAWYDYLTDHDGAAEDDVGEESLAAMRKRIGAIVDAEAALLGSHRLVLLGGASQGCCAAFDAFARHPERLGGFVGFVGHPLRTTPVAASPQRDARCCFYNGGSDDTMQLQWVRPALQRLVESGWSRVETVVAPDADHGTSEELENTWMDQFLEPLFRAGAGGGAWPLSQG